MWFYETANIITGVLGENHFIYQQWTLNGILSNRRQGSTFTKYKVYIFIVAFTTFTMVSCRFTFLCDILGTETAFISIYPILSTVSGTFCTFSNYLINESE